MKVLEVVRRGGSVEGPASSVESSMDASEGGACQEVEDRGRQLFEHALDGELLDRG